MSIFKIFDDAKNYYKSEMKAIREVESVVRIVFTGFDVIEEFEKDGNSKKDIIDGIFTYYYIYFTQIIERLDKSDLKFDDKIIFKDKLVKIGSVIGTATLRFEELGLKYGIYEKFNEIAERQQLYYECERVVNESKILQYIKS